MALYPAELAQHRTSVLTRVSDADLFFTQGGVPRARGFFQNPFTSFKVVHILNDGELTDLIQFYEDNREEQIQFFWQGVEDLLSPEFTCIFKTGPMVAAYLGNGLARVTVELTGIEPSEFGVDFMLNEDGTFILQESVGEDKIIIFPVA